MGFGAPQGKRWLGELANLMSDESSGSWQPGKSGIIRDGSVKSGEAAATGLCYVAATGS